MRELVAQYLSKSITRRGFVQRLVKAGVSAAAAEPIAQSLTEVGPRCDFATNVLVLQPQVRPPAT